MDFTRRHVILGGSTTLLLFSGYAWFRDDTAAEHVPITEMEIELANLTDESHVFHVAVETTNGLGDWHSHEVDAKTGEPVRLDFSEENQPIAIHGSVDNKVKNQELIGIERERDPEWACIDMKFYYDSSYSIDFYAPSPRPC